MATYEINYKSDFTLVMGFTLAGVAVPLPAGNFRIVFRTQEYGTEYECSRINGEYINCKDNGNDTLLCIFDRHGLRPGTLRGEVFDYIPDSTFPDGSQLVVTPSLFDIELVEGAGNTSEGVTAEVVISVEEVVGQARDAAQAAENAAEAATDAAGRANDAAGRANDAAAAATEAAADLDTKLAAKQDRLVSGTNIKTINGESLLGAGNISIRGGGDGSVLKVTLNTLNGRYSGSVTWDAMLNAYTSGKEVLLTYGDYTYRVYYAHYFESSSPPYGVINASYTYGSSVYGVTLYKSAQGTVNVSSSTTSAVTSVKSINGTSMQGSGNITLPTIAEVEAKANTSDLATVATSGSYNDLADKPTIPAAQVNADWNAASGVAAILNKPTIPVVPTNVSAFTNDASYATTSQVATAVATKADKRTYVDNSADASVELSVTTYNDLGTLSAWKTITLPASYDRADEFVFRFVCGDASLTPTLPQGVVMADNFEWSEMAVGVVFQVSIVDGIAAYLCLTPSTP